MENENKNTAAGGEKKTTDDVTASVDWKVTITLNLYKCNEKRILFVKLRESVLRTIVREYSSESRKFRVLGH